MDAVRRPSLFVALLTVACITTHGSGKTGVELHPSEEKYLAAGARFDVAVVDTCSNAETELDGKGEGKIPTSITLDIGRQTCDFSSVKSIDKAESSNQAVLTVEKKIATTGQYGVLTLQALEEGEAQISTEITTSTGVHRPGGTYTVQRANGAKLTPRCSPGAPFHADRVSVMADLPLTFAFELKRDSHPLKGYGYYPFDMGDLAITDGGVKDFTVVTPAEAKSITVTSPVDPSLKLAIDVYTRNSIDALNVKLGSEAACTATLTVQPSAGTATWFCNKAPEVDLSIETPESCSFSPSKEVLSWTVLYADGSVKFYDGIVKIYSKAKGTCRLRGQVVGGTHAESIEIPFEGCST